VIKLGHAIQLVIVFLLERRFVVGSMSRSVIQGSIMDRFYEDAASLFVRAYDAFYQGGPSQFAGDVAFYEKLTREAGGSVLELACGTGRIALPLAERGITITGIDLSDGMLTVARRKAAGRPAAVRDRLTLVNQDMSELNLAERFGLIFLPARSFQHLLTIDLQEKTLTAAHRHLQPNGRLALHLFDPRLDLLVDESTPSPSLSGTDPATQRRYLGEMVRTRFDHLAQIRRDVWRYREMDRDGAVLEEDTREMALRWTYRWELRHLLRLCGFAVEAEYSDFAGSAPAYGKELIVVARVAE
jgi:ubiquinone/menaquinone biosynthesis C-methylase UbiE